MSKSITQDQGVLASILSDQNQDTTREVSSRESAPAAVSAYEIQKRILDVCLGTITLILFLPLIALVALLVRVTSPGPIIFRQRRLGLGGRTFWCYKFRSMVIDAEEQLRKSDALKEFEVNFKLKSDPRITPLGKFLRKSSFDELPQLYNIIRGDISLVGPRPIVERELAKYGEYGPALLSVKPGLTGLWQAFGRSDISYDQRIALDMEYVRDRSMYLDLKILVVTVFVVLKGRGAC